MSSGQVQSQPDGLVPGVESVLLEMDERRTGLGHVWTAPCWQGFFDVGCVSWSVRSCVRPFDAALELAAGHNALRRTGPNH
jgi:hypothetical protein